MTQPEDPDNPIIWIDDIRLSGHCVKGARSWFEQHNLDFRDFIKNGIPADQLIAAGDALAVRVVERTKARRAQETEEG